MNEKSIKILIIALPSVALMLAIFFGYKTIFAGDDSRWTCSGGIWIKIGNPEEPQPDSGCGDLKQVTTKGMISEITESTLRLSSADGESFFWISTSTSILGMNGNRGNESDLRRGFYAEVTSVNLRQGVTKAKQIKILEEPPIILYEPRADALTGGVFPIDGIARPNGELMGYRLSDSGGRILSQGNIFLKNGTEEYMPFSIFATSSKTDEPEGIFEIFRYASADGREADKVSLPLTLNNVQLEKKMLAERTEDPDRSASSSPESQDKEGKPMEIKLYFRKNGEPDNACGEVYPVARTIIYEDRQVARKTLDLLLKGPTDSEKSQGYASDIGDQTVLSSSKVDSGRFIADFNADLGAGLAGCQALAVRNQITQTLKQFGYIKEVVISIDGNTNVLK